MKISNILTVNAVLFIILGIGFTIYAPNALAYFGIADLPGDNALLYWNIISFARMFGAILLLCGLILWAVRSLFQPNYETAQTRREILFSLVLGFVIVAITAITQASAVWGSLTGWLLTAIFVICAIVYIPFLARKEQ